MTNETEQYCAAIHPLLPAFSIGATDPDETTLVQEHLAACPQAVAELASYQMLAGVLLFSAPPLRRRLDWRIGSAVPRAHQPELRRAPCHNRRLWRMVSGAACARPCHLPSFVLHWRSAHWRSLRFWPLVSILMLK